MLRQHRRRTQRPAPQNPRLAHPGRSPREATVRTVRSTRSCNHRVKPPGRCCPSAESATTTPRAGSGIANHPESRPGRLAARVVGEFLPERLHVHDGHRSCREPVGEGKGVTQSGRGGHDQPAQALLVSSRHDLLARVVRSTVVRGGLDLADRQPEFRRTLVRTSNCSWGTCWPILTQGRAAEGAGLRETGLRTGRRNRNNLSLIGSIRA